MAKRIIVCCDGTWNHPGSQTNIFETYGIVRGQLRDVTAEEIGQDQRHALGTAPDGASTALYYVSGVGTAPLGLDHAFAGATGFGLSFNVMKAYRFIAAHYESGAGGASELFVFGFSRGAYTARSLCGFILHSGLLDQPNMAEVAQLYYATYATPERLLDRGGARPWKDRLRQFVDTGLASSAAALDLNTAPRDRRTDVKIRFLGVYDTVGALGIPVPALERVNDTFVGFHDTSIGPRIEHAVHALAIDERRGPYVPTLWTLPAGGSLAPDQTVLQVWFPGVHSDVGGGYQDHREIGDRALNFMLGQARRRGMVLDPAALPPDVPARPAAQHESYDRKWDLGRVLGFLADGRRKIDPRVDAQGRAIAGDVMIHPVVRERLDQPVEVFRSVPRVPGIESQGERAELVESIPYRPRNLPDLPVFRG